jgi:hypothetical protein
VEVPKTSQPPMTMTADHGTSLLGSGVVAAVIAAIVSLMTLSWNARRDRQDRHRKLFAEAFDACVLYREFPTHRAPAKRRRSAPERRVSGRSSASFLLASTRERPFFA